MPDLRYLGPSATYTYGAYSWISLNAPISDVVPEGAARGNVVTVPPDVAATLLGMGDQSFQDVTAGVPASPPPSDAYATAAPPAADPQEPADAVPGAPVPDPIEPPFSVGAADPPSP